MLTFFLPSGLANFTSENEDVFSVDEIKYNIEDVKIKTKKQMGRVKEQVDERVEMFSDLKGKEFLKRKYSDTVIVPFMVYSDKVLHKNFKADSKLPKEADIDIQRKIATYMFENFFYPALLSLFPLNKTDNTFLTKWCKTLLNQIYSSNQYNILFDEPWKIDEMCVFAIKELKETYKSYNKEIQKIFIDLKRVFNDVNNKKITKNDVDEYNYIINNACSSMEESIEAKENGNFKEVYAFAEYLSVGFKDKKIRECAIKGEYKNMKSDVIYVERYYSKAQESVVERTYYLFTVKNSLLTTITGLDAFKALIEKIKESFFVVKNNSQEMFVEKMKKFVENNKEKEKWSFSVKEIDSLLRLYNEDDFKDLPEALRNKVKFCKHVLNEYVYVLNFIMNAGTPAEQKRNKEREKLLYLSDSSLDDEDDLDANSDEEGGKTNKATNLRKKNVKRRPLRKRSTASSKEKDEDNEENQSDSEFLTTEDSILSSDRSFVSESEKKNNKASSASTPKKESLKKTKDTL